MPDLQNLPSEKLELTETLPICNRQMAQNPLKNHIPNHKSESPALDHAEGLAMARPPPRQTWTKALSPSPGLCPQLAAAMAITSRPWRLLFTRFHLLTGLSLPKGNYLYVRRCIACDLLIVFGEK
jgi:hypothetical protein